MDIFKLRFATTKPTKVLITVMTYPHPSRGYQELVCTAGITEDNEWVRLYPLDYRYRPRHQQFHKYQWIELELDETSHGNDNRKESRRPNLDSVRTLGEPIPTSNDWRARREILDAMPHHTLNQLKLLYETASGHWITLDLIDRDGRRNPVGANVRIEAGGHRQRIATHAGVTYLSQSDRRVHFGLGAAERIDRLEIEWPDGERQVVSNPAIDRFVEIRQQP